VEESVGNSNSSTGKNNSKDGELVTEIQKVIVKLNNLIQDIDEPEHEEDLMPKEQLVRRPVRERLENTSPEYLVDLMHEQLVQYYGRERLEESAQHVVQKRFSEESSEKFNNCGTGTNDNEDTELVAGVENVIVKVYNLVKDIDKLEYLVDLMPTQLIRCHGRERVENIARHVLQEGVSEELSKKFSALLRTLAERYFGSLGREMFSFFDAQVRYRIDRRTSTNMCRVIGNKTVIEIPASSEARMVSRLVEEILLYSVGRSSSGVYMYERNRLFDEGAPMVVFPKTRWLSAEEFIATYEEEYGP
jgi:hypothetical protein